MWRKTGKSCWMGLGFLICMTVLTGLVYPLAVTLMGKALFPHQASGSSVVRGSTVVGSALIGQSFTSPGYFWGRPSATSPMPYNAMASSGSNLGPGNPALTETVAQRQRDLTASDPGNTVAPPVDLVTASASGLDPDISPAAAMYQVGRVAKARELAAQTVRDLVERHIAGRQFGILGEPRVNVLSLNLALDAMARKADTPDTSR